MSHAGANSCVLEPDLTEMLVFSTYHVAENGPVCPVVYPLLSMGICKPNISRQNTFNVLLLTHGVCH